MFFKHPFSESQKKQVIRIETEMWVIKINVTHPLTARTDGMTVFRHVEMSERRYVLSTEN